MVALPLFKLGTLVIKQAAKPIANLVKSGAKNNALFKRIISSPAQRYNNLEQRFRMRQMGYQGDMQVKPLTDQAAVDLAANILGELVVFSIAVIVLLAEMKRSQMKEQSKEKAQNSQLVSLQEQINDLGLEVDKHSAQIRELTRRG